MASFVVFFLLGLVSFSLFVFLLGAAVETSLGVVFLTGFACRISSGCASTIGTFRGFAWSGIFVVFGFCSIRRWYRLK